MSNTSENAYVEETDYFYSLNLPGLSWQKCKFNGDLPSSTNFIFLIYLSFK